MIASSIVEELFVSIIYRYPASMRFLHWSVAWLCLGLLCSGLYMTEMEWGSGAATWYAGHKAVGVLFLALVFIRVLVRFRNAAALPGVIDAKATKILKGLAHSALYALMLVMPISGIIMSQANGYPVEVAPGWALPVVVEKSENVGLYAEATHYVSGLLLIVLIFTHVLAVAFHRFIKKDGVHQRM